jgi:hypothetical protein
MEAEATGEYIVLVIRLQRAGDGSWELFVDDQTQARRIPLQPATFVVRLRRMGTQGVLRGMVQLGGNSEWAPLQSNAQLEKLIQAWLFKGSSSADGN